jgi:hypothetical protein
LKRLNFKPVRWEAKWLGGLATAKAGDKILGDDGQAITKSKSDILISFFDKDGKPTHLGVSIKTCSKATPTNAQLFFTTASAFCDILRMNGVAVSEEAEKALKMFCGDAGYRPTDTLNAKQLAERKSDPFRWFWEELQPVGKQEWEKMFAAQHDRIAEILLRLAYKLDPFPPSYVLHQTKGCADFFSAEVAIYSVGELVALSRKYGTFELKPYFIRKGSNKGDPNQHFAPRFGIIQMQRGGQKQHPTQLQFNLKAGYFYDLEELAK